MIYYVSHKYKYAFPFIRKTGSNTIQLITLLCENKIPKLKYFAMPLIRARILPKKYSVIEKIVPDDYKIFACIRNPYTRIFSRYVNAKVYNHMPLYDFLKTLPNEGDLHLTSYENIISELPSRTKLFRFEEFEQSLKNILKELKIKVQVPHIHKSQVKRTKQHKQYYDEKSKKIIENLYKWDLEKLNYTFDSYGDLPRMEDLM